MHVIDREQMGTLECSLRRIVRFEDWRALDPGAVSGEAG